MDWGSGRGFVAARGERFQQAERMGGASRDVGRRGEWVGLSCGKREGAGLVWAGPQGLDGFLVLGFLSISPFLFLIQTNTQLGEFKF